ncbi:uncharacterized protein LOC125491278 [Plutella xylostella]|uniref:uncharacterized protein LOC125491278 n=1 Tax=Plutella xylostella TaxID=51655 RepID=UPI002032F7A6|nr:uncharacterized protein LOC125491278 [Plutella xylostella]
MSQRLEKWESRLELLERKVDGLNDLQTENEKLKKDLIQMERNFEVLDQSSRQFNIEIQNIPENKGEDLIGMTRNIGSLVGVDVPLDSIRSAHRVAPAVQRDGGGGARPRNVVVQLATRRLRDALLAAARARRDLSTEQLALPTPARRFFVNEHLTFRNKVLYSKARAEQKSKDYKHKLNMKTNKKSANLKLGLLNVCSLNTGCDELQVMMDRHAPDILALNETWTKEGQEVYAPVIPGYTLRNTPRPDDKRGGGVGFYVRRGLRVRHKPHPPSALEQMWLELTVRGAGRIAIGTAYRPGSGLSPSAAIDALSESVSMFGYCDYILIFSDFNVDLLKPNVDAAPELLSFFKQQNLFQLVQEPTRVKNGSSTLLDLVITDSRDICKSVSVHHNHILSDHGLVMTEFNIKKPPIPPVFKWIRAINKIDNDLFLKDLHAMPWEDVNEQDNIDDMVKVFNYLLNLIFDEHAPLQKVKIKESPSPWITDNIKLMMSLRDKALHRANRTQKESHFAYYKDMKNMVTSSGGCTLSAPVQRTTI